ncbi:MAG: tetratricopeptide repeat protein [Alphaproteobacteria bacterium]|jgi:hypothetical protein
MADAFVECLREAAGHATAGRTDDAIAYYRAALDLDPGNPGVFHNLGVLVAARGDPAGAVGYFDRALDTDPSYVSAHLNRANACRALGRDDEALASLRRAVALEPDHFDAHRSLGFLRLAKGERERAMDHFARTYDLRRGEDRTGMAERSLRTATREKLRHDAALFRYLSPRRRDGDRFEMLARLYDGVAAELEEGIRELSEDQLARLGGEYNGPVHLRAAPELPDGTLGGLDAAAAMREFRDGAGIAVIDGLLSSAALERLRAFLTRSTIWHDFSHIDGFVASYLEDGLACPLILQIADEVRARFSDLLRDLPLTQAWAFKGLRSREPIDLHADDGAVSLNFWVTPDAANLDPGTGGLLVYPDPPPAGWRMTDYDADREKIRSAVAQLGAPVRIPYAANRAVLFDARLFHGSDSPHFADGYENRRINVTLLYGTAARDM